MEISMIELQVLLDTTAASLCIGDAANLFRFSHQTREDVINRIYQRMQDVPIQCGGSEKKNAQISKG